jgi:hypothetical protein
MNYYPVLPCTTVKDLKYTYMAGDPLPFRVMLEINLGVVLVSSVYLRRDSCVVLAGSCIWKVKLGVQGLVIPPLSVGAPT